MEAGDNPPGLDYMENSSQALLSLQTGGAGAACADLPKDWSA